MIEVHTDGASSGNPGLSGAGIWIKSNAQQREYIRPLGVLTNHEAEFQAVIEALKICQQQYPNEILSFHSDAQLVVTAIERKFVKNKLYQPLLQHILHVSATFPHFFIKWIPSKHNKADKLAKQAIHSDSGFSTGGHS